MKVRSNWRRGMSGIAGLALGLSVLTAASVITPVQAEPPKQEKPDYSKMEKKDLVIFRSGNKVEGVVLDETETTVRVLVIVGSLRTETTYQKSEILDIKRDEFKPETKDETKKDETKPEEALASATTGSDPNAIVDMAGKPIPPGTAKVYVVEFTGEFGRDVSKTPVKAIMDDLARTKPEYIIFRFNEDFSVQGNEAPGDFAHLSDPSQAVVKSQELDTLITPRLRDDPAFSYKPTVVAWVKKALGPAAFLPLVFRDIYFTSDGHQGGVGGLDLILEGRGDEVVRQKQRSLRLAWIKGLAEQGGHDERIARAMCWSDFILSYRIVGGQAELREEMPPGPDWFLLKDDGALVASRRDTMQDTVRMRGNDYLTLDAKSAFDIGYSKGTADTLDELMYKLGTTRGFVQIKGKSGTLQRDWSKSVSKAERDVQRLLRSYRQVEVRPPAQYEQRTAARGERIRYLQQVQTICKQYGEALNPQRIGDPDNLIGQLDVAIDRIKTEQALDRRP